MKQKQLVVVAVVVLLALAGCTDVTITHTVDSDGEIEQTTIVAEMNQQAYAVALESAQEEGHDSVAAGIAADHAVELDGAVSDAETNDYRDGDTYVAEVTYNEVDIDQLDAIDTEITDDDTIVYTEDYVGDIEDGTLTYHVEMPGEIVETNADRIDAENNIATWGDESGSETETMYVESERGQLSLWSIGAIAAGAVLLTVSGFIGYRRISRSERSGEQ